MTEQNPTVEQLRAYATGTLGWAALRQLDVTYGEVLAGLGALGLRPPVAPMTGPNLEARRRGTQRLRDLLATQHL
jgi:hypothetical protein